MQVLAANGVKKVKGMSHTALGESRICLCEESNRGGEKEEGRRLGQLFKNLLSNQLIAEFLLSKVRRKF